MKLIYKEKIGNERIIHIAGIKIKYTNHQVIGLKEDKNSEVEFYLVDAFEIYHFLPIYRQLLQEGIRARIIAEPCSINTARDWFNYYEATKALKEHKIDYCTRCNPNAKIAFTTQRIEILEKYKNLKANLPYGFGLNKDSFAHIIDSCKGFDIKFTHGQFSKDILQKLIDVEKIYAIGYPKHDTIQNNPLSRNDILKELNIKTQKPIILYLPTWDDDSSIKKFSNEIYKLRKDYYILTKAHHCTFRLESKQNDLKKLYRISNKVLDGNYSFAKACTCADFYIADAKSGASIEALYINPKPAIFLSTRQDLSTFYDEIKTLATVINEPDKLIHNIKNRINSNSEINTDYFLGVKDGKSTERAVKIIKKFLNN